MTVNELIAHLNNTYSPENPFPDMLEVDHHTYANICWEIVNMKIDKEDTVRVQYPFIAFGIHGGIMFKNVELILKDARDETSL